MENTVISPERAKEIVSFAPPGLVDIVIYDRGLTPPAIFFQPFRPHIEGTLNSYPGFLESIYHNALKIELERQNLTFESEKEIEIKYLGIEVGIHRIDLLVEDEIVVELKTVEDLNKKYYAQVRSYLKALNKEIGLLVNFADFAIDVRRVELERKRSV